MWDLKGGAVHITFPPDAVSEPRMIVVHRWKPGACSPHLHEHEALVSNVIEMSTDNPAGLYFKEQVTLGLFHSATELKGYEVVVKHLIDREYNTWEDMKTNDVRRQSEIKRGDEETSEIPDLAISVAEAKISQRSSSAVFAAVCRLKCYTGFTITSLGTDVSMPDYPRIKLSVPRNAVPAGMEFHLSIKVQEAPWDEFKHKNIYPGPILRISCSQDDEFLQPITIQMPISFQEDPRDDLPNLPCSVRVLSRKSDDEDQEWTAITGNLLDPTHFDGEVVTFQVKHFSIFALLRERCAKFAEVFDALYTSYMGRGLPQKAVFTAYLDSKTLDKIEPDSRILLNLCCCATHQKGKKEEDFHKQNVSPKWTNSMKEMLQNDKAYVFPTDAAEPFNKDQLEESVLLFIEEPFDKQLPILVVKEGLCCVKFRSTKEEEDRSNTLCDSYVEIKSGISKQAHVIAETPRTLNDPVEFFGIPLDDDAFHDCRISDVRPACKRVLSPQNQRLLPEGENPEAFFGALAKLDKQVQDACCIAMVDALRNESGGVDHIADRLEKAKEVGSRRCTEELLKMVGEMVGEKVGEKEGQPWINDWRQINGDDATIRELMFSLSNDGHSNVNVHILVVCTSPEEEDSPD